MIHKIVLKANELSASLLEQLNKRYEEKCGPLPEEELQLTIEVESDETDIEKVKMLLLKQLNG